MYHIFPAHVNKITCTIFYLPSNADAQFVENWKYPRNSECYRKILSQRLVQRPLPNVYHLYGDALGIFIFRSQSFIFKPILST